MTPNPRNSRQSGEHPVDDPGDDPRLARVPPRDYVIAVALAIVAIVVVLYLGGTVE